MVHGFDTTCHVLSIEHTQLVKLNVPLTKIGRDKKQTNKKPPHNKKTSNSIAHDMSEQNMIFILIKSLSYLTMFDVCWFRHDPHIQVSIIN